MEPLEHELKNSLRRQSPSAGFTERVMARARLERRSGWSPLARWAVAGALAASLLAGVFLRQRQLRMERVQAETAAQVLFSLQIASSKIDQARQAVLESMKGGS
jgi:hypothetical protein